jgi:hypothetical protein
MAGIYGFDTENWAEPFEWSPKSGKGKVRYSAENMRFLSAQFYPPGIICYSKEEILKFFDTVPDNSRFYGWRSKWDIETLAKVLPPEAKIRYQANRGKFLEGRIIYNRKTFWVYDLRNLIPLGSLERLGELIGIPKLPRPECVKQARIPKPEEKEEFEAYAIRDAEVCYRATQKLQSSFGFLSKTLPGLALRVFRESFGGKAVFLRLPETAERLGWKAYHGGRVECFVRGTPPLKLWWYDFNSLYPYVMAFGSYPFFKSYLGEKSDVNLDHEGIADCLVKQDCDIPLLGVKRLFSDGSSKLIFPDGLVRGIFTYVELRWGEYYGVLKIRKVYKAVEWKETSHPFKKFILTYYRHRGRGEFEDRFFKLFLNSLYGKFGQDPEIEEVEVGENGLQDRKVRLSMVMNNPVIACYITSQARLKLWEEFRKVGWKHVYYTDTDSLITDKDLGEGSKELGRFKLEDVSDSPGRVTLVRSKCYIFNDEVTWKGLERYCSIALDSDLARKLIAENRFGDFETAVIYAINAFRLKVPHLSRIRRWKCFNLDEDGKRVYDKHLIGKALLDDYTFSKPLNLRDPEDVNEVIRPHGRR